MANYRRELIKLLGEHGCVFVRHGNGSHDVWRSPINGSQVVVQRDVYKLAANRVLKQAGIDKRL